MPGACLDMGMETNAAAQTRVPIKVALDRDADARVAEIYASHYQHLVGLASMLLGVSGAGEEIAQETFLIALKRERDSPGYLEDPPWPWLRTTAVRLAGHLRQRLLRDVLPHRLSGDRIDSAEAAGVATIDMMRALRRLPPKMRLCIILAHVEDLSTASIAAMLGCSTQNVDSQLRKGRVRLRTDLGPNYNNR